MTSRRSWMGRIMDVGFTVAILALLVGVLSIVTGRRLFDRLDEEIRARAEKHLAQHFPRLDVQVESARRREGKGLELERVTLRRRGPSRLPLVELDRVLVHCPTEWTGLAQDGVQPRKIELFGVKLAISAKAAGKWRLNDLIPVSTDDRAEPIPIQLHDIQATVRSPGLPTMKLVDIHAECLPMYMEDAAHPQWSVHLHSGAGASRLDIEGQVDPRTGQYVFKFESPRQELRPMVLDFVQAMGVSFYGLKPRGVLTNIESTVWGAPTGPHGAVRCRLTCDIVGARLERQGLPLALDNVHGRLDLTSERVQVTGLRASVAGAQVRASSVSWDFERQRLKADASLTGLRFDERVARLLPQRIRKLWADHQATGAIAQATWSLEYGVSEGLVQNLLHVDWRDLSFLFPALPYRFHRAHGSLVLRGDRLSLNLQAPMGGRSVQIVGDMKRVGTAGSHGWIEMGTDGPVPLNEEMIAALAPHTQRLVRSFRPQGTLKLWGYVHRDGPGQKLRKQAVVKLEDLAVNYERLPYPVNGITGAMTMKDGDWKFDLRGQNDQADIFCKGDWVEQPADRPHLQLGFHARRLALDNELLQALPVGTRRLWKDMQPRGTLDQVQIELGYDALQKVSKTRVALWKLPDGEGALSSAAPLSVFVPGLPYRLDGLTGAVVYDNGRAELKSLRGVHGGARFEMDGVALWEEGLWRVELPRLVADGFVIDRDVLDCLPPKAAANLASLQLRGPMNVDGNVALHGVRQTGHERMQAHSERAAQEATWDLTVDFEKLSARLGGVPLNNARGQVRMLGAARAAAQASQESPSLELPSRSDSGYRFAVNGEMRIDSLQSQGATVYQLQGPLTIDNASVRLGTWATAHKVRQVQARAFGGVVSADAEYKLDGSQAFEIAATLSNGQLSELARNALPVGGRVDGRAGAAVLLSGTTRGVHTLKGEGYAEMKNADIYDAPFMVNLLQLFAKEPETSLISNGNANFRIVGDRVYFDQMELEGAVRLKGAGEMTLDREIEMKFYSALRGRDNDPSLQLFREASRRILEIEVGGTLENPKITRRAFPELNDTLQRLFPETAQPRSVASGLPRLRRRFQR